MATESRWVPDTCTLPTVEQPLRVAEFDDLFAVALREVHRLAPTQLRLTFDPTVEANARDLIARESECCSLFTFSVSRTGAELVIDVEVPEQQADVLDGIAARAAASRNSA